MRYILKLDKEGGRLSLCSHRIRGVSGPNDSALENSGNIMALEDAKHEVDTAFTRKGLRGYAFENAFGGATSFLRRTYTKDLTVVDLAITGDPNEQAVTNRTATWNFAYSNTAVAAPGTYTGQVTYTATMP